MQARGAVVAGPGGKVEEAVAVAVGEGISKLGYAAGGRRAGLAVGRGGYWGFGLGGWRSPWLVGEVGHR